MIPGAIVQNAVHMKSFWQKTLEKTKRKRQRQMLSLTINLSAPICSCKDTLLWGIITTEYGGQYFYIRCKSCGTEISAPQSKIKANIAYSNTNSLLETSSHN